MTGRRTCQSCGATYHVVSNPPKTEGICDSCGAELTSRKDDEPETVKNRLKVYHQETEPLKDFYKSRGKLKMVDNQPTIELTTKVICETLDVYKRQEKLYVSETYANPGPILKRFMPRAQGRACLLYTSRCV